MSNIKFNNGLGTRWFWCYSTSYSTYALKSTTMMPYDFIASVAGTPINRYALNKSLYNFSEHFFTLICIYTYSISNLTTRTQTIPFQPTHTTNYKIWKLWRVAWENIPQNYAYSHKIHWIIINIILNYGIWFYIFKSIYEFNI